MEPADSHEVTRLLGALHAGEHEVADRLAELVYADLLRLAATRLQAGARTLDPTALVHECWIRLTDQRSPFESRSQFFAIASRLMLRVLVDADRRGGAARRGGGHRRVTLSFEVADEEPEPPVDAGRLAEALERLEGAAGRKATVARLRGLSGLSIAETAGQLGVSEATVERDWASRAPGSPASWSGSGTRTAFLGIPEGPGRGAARMFVENEPWIRD